MRRREQPTIPRVMYGTLVLTLDPDGTVRCETDHTEIGLADEYLELQPRVDAHIADMHPDLTPDSTLDGAGPHPDEGFPILTDPAAFAAYWNGLDREHRTEVLDRIRRSGDAASRCFAMNHDGYREQTELLLRQIRKIRDTVDLLANGGADRTEYGAGQEALADEILHILEGA